MSARPLLVFDMDGVLVDVKESYRETIRATVRHLCGEEPSHEEIQAYKNRGGYNNDWLLSQRLCEDRGRKIEYEQVIGVFNEYFFGGPGRPGLMERERWIAEPGVLERLNERYDFAVFTGRLHEEAQITLRRFASHLRWFAVLGDDNVAQSKPHPDGLQQLQQRHPLGVSWYLGDSVDDGRAAAAAPVPFIGIAIPGGRFDGVTPAVILNSINELEGFLDHA